MTDPRELMAIYGPCEHCGAPRHAVVTEGTDDRGPFTHHELRCTQCGLPIGDAGADGATQEGVGRSCETPPGMQHVGWYNPMWDLFTYAGRTPSAGFMRAGVPVFASAADIERGAAAHRAHYAALAAACGPSDPHLVRVRIPSDEDVVVVLGTGWEKGGDSGDDDASTEGSGRS